MSRVQNIITEARRFLGDLQGVRYSDDSLIAQLNKGIKRANIIGKFIKAKSYVKLELNTSLYDLSDQALFIERVEYMDKSILVRNSSEMDRLDSDWHNTIGEDIKYVIFEHLNSCAFKVYPKLNNNVANNISQNQFYGGLIDIEIVEDLLELPVNSLESYGYKYLVVFYTKKHTPVTINTADIDLEFDSELDDALCYYVGGMALRSGLDSNNRTLGAEQLTLFETSLSELVTKQTTTNNSVDYKTIPYRGFM